MWTRLKKGVRSVLVQRFRMPEDEWKAFRALRPAMTPSEQLRLAVKAWIAANR